MVLMVSRYIICIYLRSFYKLRQILCKEKKNKKKLLNKKQRKNVNSVINNIEIVITVKRVTLGVF